MNNIERDVQVLYFKGTFRKAATNRTLWIRTVIDMTERTLESLVWPVGVNDF